MARVLVAGIGNIFLGDDGFGVEVVRRLNEQSLPENVEVADYGIRGIHLAYELADGQYDGVILVDAVPRGEAPGTLYAIEPELDGSATSDAADAHNLSPAVVLSWLRRIGGRIDRVVIVGCEPESVEESMGLSPPVEASLDGAVAMVRDFAMRMSAPCA